MRRLRILQIFSRYLNPGGEENSVYRIGDTLQQDHDVEYLLGSTQELLGTDLFSRASAPFLAYHNVSSVRRLKRYQEIGRFDLWLVHNVLPGLSPSVYQAAFQLGVPIVHYLHNYRMGCVNGFFLNHGHPCERCLGGNFFPAFQTACWRESRVISGLMALVTLRARRLGIFRKVSAWIALSRSQRDKHIQMGIPAETIHVVPHFYQPKGDPPPPCPEGDVLFLGRLSREKGVDHLLRAWKMLLPAGRWLRIAGNGPEMPKLRALARDLGLTQVEFLGFLEPREQREVWRRCAFSVVPSVWNEPFGLVVLESWAHGRPVVASRLGAMEEIVREEKDGLFAEPFSPKSLAEKIRRLLSDPGLCASMGAAGQNRLLGEFNSQVWLGRINPIFQNLLNRSPLDLT